MKLDEIEPGDVFNGVCHDCGADVVVTVTEEGVTGGAVYNKGMKCDKCFAKNPVLTDYQECEVYSRSVGYLRPIKQWNPGKQAEFEHRKTFDYANSAEQSAV
jgi:anaerobic ribonucleoside-triphosphate reductase